MATTTAPVAKPTELRVTQLESPAGPWSEHVPRRVTAAYRRGFGDGGWDAWRDHLAERRLLPVNKVLPDGCSSLGWALPADTAFDAARSLIGQLSRIDRRSRRRQRSKIEHRAAQWLHDAPAARCTSPYALECLAWGYSLAGLSSWLPERLWWNLLNRLIALASGDNSVAPDAFTTQLIGGELPLALAYLFPELTGCETLAQSGDDTICQGIGELLTDDCLPRGTHLDLLRPLLACWTRSRTFGERLSDGGRDAATSETYSRFVQTALRLSWFDGRQVLAPKDSAGWDAGLVKLAVRLSDDDETRRLARVVIQGDRPRKRQCKNLPTTACESKEAGIALLRTDWTRRAPELGVNFANRQISIELHVGRRYLWSGIWSLDVRFNDEPLEPRANWEQTCWVSDDDVDYLELGIQLSQEVTVERHLLLARKDRILFLADAVLGIQSGAIAYRGTLPLAGHSEFRSEAENHEGVLLCKGRPSARVLPLELPEWRTGPTRGSLHAVAEGLELKQSIDAQYLFAPLWIDLEARRIHKPVTWRQLTVAHNRAIVPRETAVGYRARVGKRQWLVYRSLAEPDIRTVLGKNLMTEFLVGRFPDDGQVETILEIE